MKKRLDTSADWRAGRGRGRGVGGWGGCKKGARRRRGGWTPAQTGGQGEEWRVVGKGEGVRGGGPLARPHTPPPPPPTPTHLEDDGHVGGVEELDGVGGGTHAAARALGADGQLHAEALRPGGACGGWGWGAGRWASGHLRMQARGPSTLPCPTRAHPPTCPHHPPTPTHTPLSVTWKYTTMRKMAMVERSWRMLGICWR